MPDFSGLAELIDNFKTVFNASYTSDQEQFVTVRSALSLLLEELDITLFNLDIYGLTDTKLFMETLSKILMG